MLTIQEIKNAKVGDKPRKLYDRDGLYLFVTPTGGKLWRGKYRVNGREKTLSLGPYPKVGLAEAREKWQDARKLDDPSAAKQAEKQSSDSTTPTFLAVAKEWHARQTQAGRRNTLLRSGARSRSTSCRLWAPAPSTRSSRARSWP
jgi:hypothetical protein